MIDARTFGELSERRLREEIPSIDPRLNTVLVQLNRTSSNLISEFESKVHKSLNLTWSGYRLLFVLWVMGDIEPVRAAEFTNTSRASVSSLSSSFEKRGLLTRSPSPDDGRSIVLSLTDEGRRLVKAAVEQQERLQRKLLADFTDSEQEILSILLNKLSLSRSIERESGA
ncbi:MarR family winged helix-turn-helix transcriptional regulator [Rothia aerolata]|uniref:MarR family transcriptional regulator n=1 Tax=Rothia aerolata TaxID=1812262 RepID=A0A917IWU4_9MICC|nr:MarR family transcriptional regulator [Rothia aerolata]GGH66239.1 MarR family transcriptional regulator [Rothia aerolata]